MLNRIKYCMIRDKAEMKYVRRISITAILILVMTSIMPHAVFAAGIVQDTSVVTSTLNPSDIPEYDGTPFVILNNNVPDFSIGQITTDSYVSFSPFDDLGRTGSGMACLGKETIPKEARGEIGDIRPSGWHTVRYDDLIPDRYLYNRCHVVGYQLCGDNATPENLFTGTRYLNIETMLFFENMVASYLNNNPENHVIYRSSPIYRDNDLVAIGVQMEAYSVEDAGADLCYNAFVYNVQPGIIIDYATGDSIEDIAYVQGSEKSVAQTFGELTGIAVPAIISDFAITTGTDEEITVTKVVPNEEEPAIEQEESAENIQQGTTYILNTNTKIFHYPDCSSVSDMKEKNKKEYSGTRDEVINMGYVPCKRCKP